MRDALQREVQVSLWKTSSKRSEQQGKRAARKASSKESELVTIVYRCLLMVRDIIEGGMGMGMAGSQSFKRHKQKIIF